MNDGEQHGTRDVVNGPGNCDKWELQEKLHYKDYEEKLEEVDILDEDGRMVPGMQGRGVNMVEKCDV
ncbi:hypothetical protein NDU88_008338 [Pleurodeles waltl]|uniref:Uncharacterized protein n=1 Tax=Pleurodeles waltl TaxID=8319 RepID=A0AAV7P3D9_PLEWA|nr:hypothetical protein NDU88_008338 [Pleurodeles waltl]